MRDGAAVPRLLGSSAGPLSAEHDLVLLDLDGVVYAGPHPLPGVAGHLGQVRAAGSRLGFITNNAARTAATVAQHLRDLGVDAADGDVVTSAQAAARLVAQQVPPGSSVLVVGGEGLVAALADHDLVAVWSADDRPAAVVQGFHPSVGWQLLAEGAYALATGIPWVATNLDPVLPTERGRAPGNGMLVEALRVASGREPQVAGKPQPALFDEAQRLLGGGRTLVVGDRIDSDIGGASAAGLPSLLVLTGISSLADACAATGRHRPTYLAADLAGLLVRHPEVEPAADGAVRCGRWRAVVHAGRVRLDGAAPSAEPPAEPPAEPTAERDAADVVAALRAVVAACWARTGDGAGSSGDTVDLHEVEHQLRDMMA